MAKSKGSHPGESKNGPFVGPLYKGAGSNLGPAEVSNGVGTRKSAPDPLGLKKVG